MKVGLDVCNYCIEVDIGKAPVNKIINLLLLQIKKTKFLYTIQKGNVYTKSFERRLF